MGPRETPLVGPLAAGEAARHIVGSLAALPAAPVALDDALGLVLAEAVTSPMDVPAWTNSAMDGYAARGADVRGATPEHPVVLSVIEELPAGRFPTREVGPAECIRIFTGAPLPAGADSVIRQEDTDHGTARVQVFKDRDVGVNIRQAGEDIRRGALALAAGTALGPAELGVLASLAIATPLVHRRPRVAILGSGDEIAHVTETEAIRSGRKVASSNSHTLAALVRLAGAEPVNLGIAQDTRESVMAHLAAAQDADLLVTSAGISVGEHDHLRSAVQALGGRLDFWKLRMRPGAPVGFGWLPRTEPGRWIPWIGLPGNPVSAMVTFELFVRPAIRRLLGFAAPFRCSTPVTLTEPVRVGARLQHFLRAIVQTAKDGGYTAGLTGPQGSGILTSMVRANALLLVPEGVQQCDEGARLDALRFDDTRHQAAPAF